MDKTILFFKVQREVYNFFISVYSGWKYFITVWKWEVYTTQLL